VDRFASLIQVFWVIQKRIAQYYVSFTVNVNEISLLLSGFCF
jgi:hypothetical protein